MKLNARKPRADGRAPRARSEALRLDDFLPYRLSVLTNTISSTLAQSYADRFGISIPQWRVMAVLGSDADEPAHRSAKSRTANAKSAPGRAANARAAAGRTANELVARTRLDKVTVSRAVAGLVAAGRVRRRTDPVDRRRKVLRLSARGRAIYEQIVPLARGYETELLSRLEPGERAALDRLLRHLDESALAIAETGPLATAEATQEVT